MNKKLNSETNLQVTDDIINNDNVTYNPQHHSTEEEIEIEKNAKKIIDFVDNVTQNHNFQNNNKSICIVTGNEAMKPFTKLIKHTRESHRIEKNITYTYRPTTTTTTTNSNNQQRLINNEFYENISDNDVSTSLHNTSQPNHQNTSILTIDTIEEDLNSNNNISTASSTLSNNNNKSKNQVHKLSRELSAPSQVATTTIGDKQRKGLNASSLSLASSKSLSFRSNDINTFQVKSQKNQLKEGSSIDLRSSDSIPDNDDQSISSEVNSISNFKNK
jgi:hypothetical protein